MTGLSVHALTLSHFRSHKVSRLELSGKPVAIFGPNGAGKTNVLEAISLLSPGRGLRRASAADMTRKAGVDGWKISAVLNSQSHLYEIETWSEGGAARQVKIDGKSAPQNALGEIARVLWLIPSMDRLWIEGAEGRRRFLDRMVLSFLPEHADAVLTYEKCMRERNRLLKDQVRDPSWYLALEKQMADVGAQIWANRHHTVNKLTDAQEAAETSFPKADLALFHIDDSAPKPEQAQDLAAAFADNRALDIRAGRTLIGPHRADLGAVYAEKDVPAKDCSTGEQKALLISLILANGRALANEIGAPPILLLDEVAAHLDSSRRAALYDELCALNAQAFMTGTGAELFVELGARADHLEVTDNDGTSEIRVAK
ncbi:MULTISPECIES: DNA replication/repair protein RecF [Halocynthiibacter]|uniref:DNA replication and repair protein RecF n=1 Tax=Halocynthiibacter halioticoli TaxID=2986804 RepID=A0AAE3J0P3_9RHOB|nr:MULTISPECIES: DNA replication/repair protein RecF [Halocynthiibacter]MCV6823052.1 DNA replication/repair protein RecF [Halocynthiibacter halioticoli]MCW4056053.1 DNA replication/repair protein RecF [Halocynthiibacter sp. SDUM655004]